jgi:hypothetical protein
MLTDHLGFQQHRRGKRKRKDFVPAAPLDLDDLRRSAEPVAEHQENVLVGMARAEALMRGERNAAYRYVEPLVWGRY